MSYIQIRGVAEIYESVDLLSKALEDLLDSQAQAEEGSAVIIDAADEVEEYCDADAKQATSPELMEMDDERSILLHEIETEGEHAHNAAAHGFDLIVKAIAAVELARNAMEEANHHAMRVDTLADDAKRVNESMEHEIAQLLETV